MERYNNSKETESENAMVHRSYFVTGANNGCGFEATRLLALQLSEAQNTNNNKNNGATTIFLLCRSEEKANVAIQEIQKSLDETNSNGVRLKFMKFDAYDDEATIRKNIGLALEGEETKPTIAGILLNAGGFGEPNKSQTKESSLVACGIAKLNLIGHVFLVRNLLKVCHTDSSTRIIAVSSEAAFCTPGIDYESADFVAHLSGTVANKDQMMGANYAWTKGILALYWAAYARHHSEYFVATVSPGAVPSTKLLSHVSPALRTIAKITQLSCFGGSHTAQDGAERYVMALLGTGPFQTATSGEFWASTRGFAQDFGRVSELKKGKFVADTKLQDKAWEAVQKFV